MFGVPVGLVFCCLMLLFGTFLFVFGLLFVLGVVCVGLFCYGFVFCFCIVIFLVLLYFL